jgi:hypothetical protein
LFGDGLGDPAHDGVPEARSIVGLAALPTQARPFGFVEHRAKPLHHARDPALRLRDVSPTASSTGISTYS